MEAARKDKDPLFRIKYMGYCMSQPPPDEEETSTMRDLLRHAKFTLANSRSILMHDPVWDSYSEEQILVEYYALIYAENKQAREEFLLTLRGDRESELDYMDRKIAENQKELSTRAKLPTPVMDESESFEYVPDAIDEEK